MQCGVDDGERDGEAPPIERDLRLLRRADSTGGCNTLKTARAVGVLQMKQRRRIYYSEPQVKQLRAGLDARNAACKPQLHPEKTKIVYCKDDNRRGSYPVQRFDFLGHCFRPGAR
jgi:hypothetical protein